MQTEALLGTVINSHGKQKTGETPLGINKARKLNATAWTSSKYDRERVGVRRLGPEGQEHGSCSIPPVYTETEDFVHKQNCMNSACLHQPFFLL